MRETYKTKQKEEILAYLMSLGNSHVTVAQVAAYFARQQVAIGMTTIYRHLEKLVQLGEVKKFTTDQTKGACYQYLGSDSCAEHYHFKCQACGRVMHVECSQLDLVLKHIAEEHGFVPDLLHTIFVGTCAACAQTPQT